MFLGDLYAKLVTSSATMVGSTATSISSAIMPLFWGAIALYIVYVAYTIIQNGEIIMTEVVKTIAMLSLATFFIGSTGAYITYVVPFFQGLAESLGSAITGNQSDSMDLVSQFWTAYDPAFKIMKEESQNFSWWWWTEWGGYSLSALILTVSQILISFTIALNLIICKFMLNMVLSLGPFFFALGCFPPTRNFLNLWIGQAFNYVILTLFYVLAAHIVCTYIMDQAAQITDSISAWALSWEILVITLILVTLLGQLAGVAQGLAGGVSMKTSGGLGAAVSKGVAGAGSLGRGISGAKSATSAAKGGINSIKKVFSSGVGK